MAFFLPLFLEWSVLLAGSLSVATSSRKCRSDETSCFAGSRIPSCSSSAYRHHLCLKSADDRWPCFTLATKTARASSLSSAASGSGLSWREVASSEMVPSSYATRKSRRNSSVCLPGSLVPWPLLSQKLCHLVLASSLSLCSPLTLATSSSFFESPRSFPFPPFRTIRKPRGRGVERAPPLSTSL